MDNALSAYDTRLGLLWQQFDEHSARIAECEGQLDALAAKGLHGSRAYTSLAAQCARDRQARADILRDFLATLDAYEKAVDISR